MQNIENYEYLEEAEKDEDKYWKEQEEWEKIQEHKYWTNKEDKWEKRGSKKNYVITNTI